MKIIPSHLKDLLKKTSRGKRGFFLGASYMSFMSAFPCFGATAHYFKDVQTPPWEEMHHITSLRTTDACAVTDNIPPYRVMLGSSKTGLELWIANDKWHLDRTHIFPLTLTSGKYRLTGTLTVIEPHKLQYVFNEKDFIEAINVFLKEKKLSIKINERTHFKLALSKGHRALRMFKKCSKENAFAAFKN